MFFFPGFQLYGAILCFYFHQRVYNFRTCLYVGGLVCQQAYKKPTELISCADLDEQTDDGIFAHFLWLSVFGHYMNLLN